MKIGNIEIKIGSIVRFINDTDLYTGVSAKINVPTLYGFYKIRGFSTKGFYLESVENDKIGWTNDGGEITHYSEPGFASWRFEPVADSILSIDELMKEARTTGIKIEIPDLVKV